MSWKRKICWCIRSLSARQLIPDNIWHRFQGCLSKIHSFHTRPQALAASKKTHFVPRYTCLKQYIFNELMSSEIMVVQRLPSDSDVSSANSAVLPHICSLAGGRAVPHLNISLEPRLRKSVSDHHSYTSAVPHLNISLEPGLRKSSMRP